MVLKPQAVLHHFVRLWIRVQTQKLEVFFVVNLLLFGLVEYAFRLQGNRFPHFGVLDGVLVEIAYFEAFAEIEGLKVLILKSQHLGPIEVSVL